MQNGNSGSKSKESQLIVIFNPATRLNKAKSLLAGTDQHDDIDEITVIAPGERAPILGPVQATEKHKADYPMAWAAYKEKRKQPSESGLPLELWPLTTLARVEEFKSIGIRTVEALAMVSDERLRNLGMGGRDLRQKAQDYIASAKSAAPLAQMREEIESIKLLLKQKDEAIAALQAEVSKRKEPSLDEAYTAAIEPKKSKGKKE